MHVDIISMVIYFNYVFSVNSIHYGDISIKQCCRIKFPNVYGSIIKMNGDWQQVTMPFIVHPVNTFHFVAYLNEKQ